MQAFLKKQTTSANCTNCRYRQAKHDSDFYIGDAWNVNRIRTNIDDNYGITTVFANTEKATEYMDELRAQNRVFDMTLDEALYERPDLLGSSENMEEKEKFYEKFLKEGWNFTED
jgi:hypothetical protein